MIYLDCQPLGIMGINTITQFQDNRKVFFESIKNKGPEYRILYFPQDLVITLRESFMNDGDEIGAEDTHNNAYLFELNSFFKKKGVVNANTFLDQFEEENKEQLDAHCDKIMSFTDTVKQRFLTGSPDQFVLDLTHSATMESVVYEIRKKYFDILPLMHSQGNKYMWSNKIHYRKYQNIISAQIKDITFLALEYIAQDKEFLQQLLEKYTMKLPASMGKIKGLLEETMRE